jgi:predicted PurR-regulated permease PerM
MTTTEDAALDAGPRPVEIGGQGEVDDPVDRETIQARQVMARANFSVRDVSLAVLTILAVLYTLYFASSLIVPLVLALVLGLLLGPPVEFLNRRLHVPRMLAALVAILLLFSVIGGIGYAISVPATGWIAKAPQSLPTLEAKLSFLKRPIAMVQGGMAQMEKLMQQAQPGRGEVSPGDDAAGADHPTGQSDQPASSPGKPAAANPQAAQASPGGGGLRSGMGSVGLSVLSGTRAFLGQIFTLMIVLFFLLADGDSLLRRFVEILPGLSEKKRAVQIATEVERNISLYLVTITMMNLLVGAANGLSIWAFGLPDPLLWGTLAFLLNYIPILGPMTGVVIFFFVGLFTFTSVGWAFAPAGVYLLIHVLEGETVTPMLLARRFTLNPLLVIVSLMFWDWLWGITGALLAVPLLAVTKILCDHIEVLTPLGHLLGSDSPNHRRPNAEQAKPQAG